MSSFNGSEADLVVGVMSFDGRLKVTAWVLSALQKDGEWAALKSALVMFSMSRSELTLRMVLRII
jgi:hypothetical protein